MTLRIGGSIGVLCLVPLAVVGLGTLSRPLPETMTIVFFGAGGSLAQYLFGMTVLLFPSLSVAIYFSLDWHRRWPLLAIRHGNVSRWLWNVLARQSLVLVAYVGGLIVYIVGLRVLLGERAEHDWSATLAEAALALFKLYATCLFFTILTMLVVVFFKTDAAGVIAVPVILAFALLPFNTSPWNPFTAWSMNWFGDQEVTACVAVACGTAVACLALFALSHYLRESEPPHADR